MNTWIVRIFGVVLMSAAMVAATQWVAYRLGHGPGLGRRIVIGEWNLYPPWGVLSWTVSRYGTVPPAFQEGRLILLAGALATAVAVMRFGFRRPKVRPVGADKWAGSRGIRKAGLTGQSSTTPAVVVGRSGRAHPQSIAQQVCGKLFSRWRLRGKLLQYDGPEHQLVAGATRSGKGVGHVIPTLLTWTHSVLVYDIKGELWEATAGFRSRFSHTFFFNPTRPDSVRYNPLLEVRRGPDEIRDVQNIVEMLVNPTGEKQTFDVWDQHASQVLVALILHVLYAESDKSLGRVRDLLLDFDDSFPSLIRTLHRTNPQTNQPEPHPEVVRVAKDMLAQPPKFQAGVRATAAGYLILFADELVRRNTSVSDFRVGDLMCAGHPVTLYLQPPPSDGPRLRPLMRILLNQACRALLEHLDADASGRPKHHKLLLELDEFATLGRLDFLQSNLRQMAGYGIKAHLIVQSFSDIVESYGRDNTILDNCHVMVSFACADTVTQQRVSQMTGTVTEYRRNYSRPRLRKWLWGFRPGESLGSLSDVEQVRPLMQPGDVRELPEDEQLVFVTGHPPIRCRKVRHYQDPEFKNRLLPPPVQMRGLDVPPQPSTMAWSAEEHSAGVMPGTVADEPDTSEVSSFGEGASVEPPTESDVPSDHANEWEAADFDEEAVNTLFNQNPANEPASALPATNEPADDDAPLFRQAREDRYAL